MDKTNLVFSSLSISSPLFLTFRMRFYEKNTHAALDKKVFEGADEFFQIFNLQHIPSSFIHSDASIKNFAIVMAPCGISFWSKIGCMQQNA